MRALSSPHSMRGAPVAVARQVSRRARTLFASPVRAELLSVRSNPLAASSLSVFAATDGRSVPVSELAPKSTVASAELHAQLPELTKLGFDLRIIGVGTAEGGRKFAGLLNPPLPVDLLYVDPQRELYQALGLYHGYSRTFFNKATPLAIQKRGLDSVKEAAKNYTLIPPPNGMDDGIQQGGLLVVGPLGEIAYAWRDEGTADHAPIEAVIAAVRSAAATATGR